jgi:hypothetical protein
MATGLGYPAVMGAGKEATYMTGVHATDRISYLDESISEQIGWVKDDVISGSAGRSGMDIETNSVTGQIKTETRYTQASTTFFSGNDLLLAVGMGGAPAELAANVISYKLGEAEAAPHVTIAVQKGVAIWEAVSTYISGFTLSSKPGDFLHADFDVIAWKILKTGTYNEAAEFTALAAKGGKRVLFGDFTFRLGATNDILAAGDNIGLGDFKLTFKNNLSGPTFMTPDAGVSNAARYTIEPVYNGFRECDIEFKLPRYMGTTTWATQLETWKSAATPLQLSGETSIDSAAKTFKLLCPHLIIEDIQTPVAGPQALETTVKAKLFRGAAVPNTVMHLIDDSTDIVDEFAIEIKNTTDGRTAVPY